MTEAQIVLPSRPMSSLSWGRVVLSVLALAVWLAALAVVGLIFTYQYLYQDRIYEGVSVRGIDLSGATLAEAEQRLRAAYDPFPLRPLTVRYGDRSWLLTAEDLGVRFDVRAAAEAAYRVGRRPVSQEGWLARAAQVQANLQEQLAAYLQGREVLAVEFVDTTAGLRWLNERAQEINRPVVEASLRIEGLKVITSPSQVGYTLDVPASQRTIYDALLANRGGTVDLVVHETQPLLADVGQAAAFVRRVFAGPVTLVAPEPDPDTGAPPPSYTISTEQLASLISLHTVTLPDGSLELTATLDVQPLRPLVQSWAAKLAREPRDARLDFDPDTGAISVVTPSQVGRVLDVSQTLAAIYRGALSETRQVTLPLRLVEPAVNMHRIDEMGIVELVAEGQTSFRGSSADRVHNIATAVAAVDGIVVPPGQVFSFNKAIGEVDAEHGYKDSLIIWGDRTAVGIGGGVCQVSTTLFRAAYFAGLPIVERYNHGYVVSWYGEPGLDATIYTPNIDFKFRNTTDHYLLIKAELDRAKGTLTFKLYGTKPGWQVEVSGPEITNEVKPGPPIYQEDAELRRGQVRQVEWPKKGMDVAWRRVVTDSNGQVLSDEILRSHYTPWPAYYLVGPGTRVPATAEFRPLAETQPEE